MRAAAWACSPHAPAELPAPSGLGADHYTAASAWHSVVGSFAFGSIFMATDPVSAAQTNTGRWIYGSRSAR